ncbi:hypothetical protein [Thioclava sp. GXIMD2076]|uniref:Dihydroorotate dehydrogenase n=1 Tax=Thioclava kandeliae TaxID=3070818 RepID=A0ABV1SD35_9RHOB
MVDEQKLEPFWQAARDHAPEASPDFLARIMGDALEVQQGFGVPRKAGVMTRLGGFMQDLARNWLPMGGMVAAACTGVAIGFSSGNPLAFWGNGAVSSAQATTIELLPTGDLFSVSGYGISLSGVN